MQKIHLLVISVFTLFFTACQKKPVEFKLKGNIKTIVQYSWQAVEVNDKFEPGYLVSTCIFHLDPAGRLTGIDGTDVTVSCLYTEDNSYNRMIWGGSLNEDEKHAMLEFIDYEYFLQREECVEKWEVIDSLTSPVTCRYEFREWDPEFNILRISAMDEGKKLLFVEQIRFDEKGKILNNTLEKEDLSFRKGQWFYDDTNECGEEDPLFYGETNRVQEWINPYLYKDSFPRIDHRGERDGDFSYTYLKCDKKGNWTEKTVSVYRDRVIKFLKREYVYY